MTEPLPLILLSQNEVRTHWPELRPGIAEALSSDPDGLLPEDAFTAIMAGEAGCYATREAGVVTGFVIARKTQIAGRAVMVAWLGFNGNRETGLAGFWPQIVEIARSIGCSRIAVESPRPYDRAVPGLNLVSHTFHYEVGDGRE